MVNAFGTSNRFEKIEESVARVVRSTIGKTYVHTLKRSWGRFVEASTRPEQAQRRRLASLLELGAQSDFGRQHGLQKISEVKDFQKRVPIRDYDDYSPWIERILKGENNVLSAATVNMVELSGGSTQSNKYIPYTNQLIDEFSKSTNPWIYNLYTAFPELVGTQSYWSISPAMKNKAFTEGGVPIGFEDDTEYFSPIERWALKNMMAVPNTVARLSDLHSWRMTTLKYLLEAKDLGFISVWSPTFLTLLMESLQRNIDNLLSEVTLCRAKAIEKVLKKKNETLNLELIWPKLRVISCWTDGWAKSHVTSIRRWFPSVVIQSKGLLATEGVVSFPVHGYAGSVLAVGSHFLEFLDVENPSKPPVLAHKLRKGAYYSPVLTTGGGLYRYHLKDVVECAGWFSNTPLVRFEGKLDAVSDMCGEKLNAQHVEKAVSLAQREAGLTCRFAQISPMGGKKPHYCFFVETECDDATLAKANQIIEEQLRLTHHYNYCRQLGQLGGLRVTRVEKGWERYSDVAMENGRRAGDIKPLALDVHGWAMRAFCSADVHDESGTFLKELER